MISKENLWNERREEQEKKKHEKKKCSKRYPTNGMADKTDWEHIYTQHMGKICVSVLTFSLSVRSTSNSTKGSAI